MQSKTQYSVLYWILANIIGWALAYSGIVFLSGGWFFYWTSVLWGGCLNLALIGGIMGAVVGLAQWLVLKHYHRTSPIWIITNIIGWSVTYIFLTSSLTAIFGLLSMVISSILLIALPQALILKMSRTQKICWCITVIFGWSLGWIAGSYSAFILGDTRFYWVTGIGAGIIYGISTGTMLSQVVGMDSPLPETATINPRKCNN